MGIDNLLKELKPITNTNIHLSRFQGQRCGVDASCWLHRAAHSCALDLVLGKETRKYLDWITKCLNLLGKFNIKPTIVFDGAQLPMKANEEHKRGESRKDNKEKAKQCLRTGDKQNAYKYAQMAVRITKEMVTGFIQLCIDCNIQFVCAPYEGNE